MLDTVSAPCCRGLSQGRLPQDAVQCLDVALKQPALFHPRVRTLPHAFFLEDPASAIGLGGPSEVSTVVRQPLKVLQGLRCATAAASRGAGLTLHGVSGIVWPCDRLAGALLVMCWLPCSRVSGEFDHHHLSGRCHRVASHSMQQPHAAEMPDPQRCTMSALHFELRSSWLLLTVSSAVVCTELTLVPSTGSHALCNSEELQGCHNYC